MATPSTFRVYAAIALFLALVPAAPAAEEIDQINLPEWDGGWTHVNPAGGGQAVMWQTFTPTCTNLTAVEIDILTISPGRGDDVLTVEIAGDGVFLASAERAVEDGYDGLLRFEFPEVVPLVSEQLYELAVRDMGKTRFGWKYGANTYERGSRYVLAQQQLGSDWFFRTYAWVESAATKYSGGTGEPNDPYQIATAADLIALGETPEDYDKHFILTADIDLDPNLPGRKVFDKAVIGPYVPGSNELWKFFGTPFTGVFDGNRHTISHLTITGGCYLGLFGRLGPDARVSNLRLEAVEINAAGWGVGGLAGYNSGSIAASYSTGSVSGTSHVGGLVGSNLASSSRSLRDFGRVSQCYSSGSVVGVSSVGGLTGENWGSITTSYSAASVTGTGTDVGGLVGSGSLTTVDACVWDVETSGLSGSAGGVGLTTAEMRNPEMLGLNGFANDPNWVLDAGRDYPRLAWQGTAGSMIPEPEIDWLDGQGTAESPYRIDAADQLILLGRASILWNDHFILDVDLDLDPALPGRCILGQALIPVFTGVFDGKGYAISNLTIEGGSYLGLFGYLLLPAQVANLRVVDVNIIGSGDYVGSLVGDNFGSIANCHSSGSVSGVSNIGGLVGVNARDGSIATSYGNGSVSGDSFVGGLVGYTLGTIEQSYSTCTVSGSYDVGGLTGYNLGHIATSDAMGEVNGMHHVGGLVGDNGWDSSITTSYSSGSVRGVGFVGGLVGINFASILASYSTSVVIADSFVGGLIGGNRSGDVKRCYSTTAVVANENVGGLIGDHTGGAVETCYAAGYVTGSRSVGGLVGLNDSVLMDSYSLTIVTGNNRVGGLVGKNSNAVRRCYSAGAVNGDQYVGGLVGSNIFAAGTDIAESFWDVVNSGSSRMCGLGSGDNALGKTTAEMQTASTFLDAGWDFVGETANGTEDIWWILEGQDYPRLWWEAGELTIDD